MSISAATWYDDDDPRDILRWAIAAAVVIAIHVAAIAGYAYIHRPDEIGDEASVVAVELAPIESTAEANQRDIAPAPEEMVEQKTVPEPQKEPEPPKVEEPPPPETTMSEIAQPEQKPLEKVEEKPVERRPPAPQTAAQVKGGAPRVAPSWQTALVRHLQAYKRYPSEAQSRGEQGTVLLSFSVDRTGHVLSHSVMHSSGYADLDAEVTAMIERAQPLPPFPAAMTEAKLDLTVPIRFSLH